MKKSFCLFLSIFLLCLSSCSDPKQTEQELPPGERATVFFSQAEELYYENGSIELYGETLQNLVPAVDGFFPAKTNALERLHNFDLSAYTEIESQTEGAAFTQSFYIGKEDELCKVTLAAHTSMTGMTIGFLFENGDEYYVVGPFSNELLELVAWVQSALPNAEEVEGNIRAIPLNTDGTEGEPYMIQRGQAIWLCDIFELTMEKTKPTKQKDCIFDLKLEIIDGDTYLVNSDELSFQKGSENGKVYTIECEEPIAKMLKSFLR